MGIGILVDSIRRNVSICILHVCMSAYQIKQTRSKHKYTNGKKPTTVHTPVHSRYQKQKCNNGNVIE